MNRQRHRWTAGLLLSTALVFTASAANPLAGQDGGLPVAEMLVDDCAACAAPMNDTTGCGGSCSRCFDCPPMLTDHTYFDPPATCEVVDPRIYRSIFLGHLWFEAEYLAWVSSGTRLPTLLVSNAAGPIGGDVDVLFGDMDVHDSWRSGGRLTGGYWFTPAQCVGVEASFFGIDGNNVEYNSSRANGDTVSRYLIDRNTGGAYAIAITQPDEPTRASRVESDMLLTGAEVLWRQMIGSEPGHRLDYVAGYRYVRLNESLYIQDDMTPYDAAAGAPSENIAIDRSDRFETESEFHGAEFGLISRWWHRRWAVQTLGKVALGGTRSGATVEGAISRVEFIEGVDDPRVSAAPVGVLATPSNSGRYGQSEFSAVGEAGVRLEYAATRQCRLTFGYTFLYLSSVTRVLDSVDVVVDPSQIPDPNDPDAIENYAGRGADRPEFTFRNSNFWTQGLSIGVHYDF